MQESYAKAMQEASEILTQAVLETEPNLEEVAREVDGLIRSLLRVTGRLTMEAILGEARRRVTEAAQREGMRVHRRKGVRFFGLFGPMEVDSPYLYDRMGGRSARPVKDRLGIMHQGRSRVVDRALTDFGVEESFGQAARRFQEHYGWSVGRSTVLRVVEDEAESAQAYVESRLEEERSAFEEPLTSRPGADQVLIELDGCEIRTGTLQPAPEPERTPGRRPPRRRRVQQWREVRVGLARQLDEVEPTYVARMDKYPEVVSSLFRAAVSHGLSGRSETIGVADGGNGLKDELEVQFPNLTFILDRPHVQKHLHEAAEAMGLNEEARQDWIDRQTEKIDAGRVREVISELRQYEGQGTQRLRQLVGYLQQFRDCMDYNAYTERGLPIGSGEVESAHRSIPQKRLKLPGATWKPETINPMLALRVIRANDWWEDYWETKNIA